MNVSLTEELETLVNEKVKSGLYTSASEVIRAGLRLLKQEEDLRASKLKLLKKEINSGVRQSRAGLSTPFDAAEIKRLGRERFNLSK